MAVGSGTAPGSRRFRRQQAAHDGFVSISRHRSVSDLFRSSAVRESHRHGRSSAASPCTVRGPSSPGGVAPHGGGTNHCSTLDAWHRASRRARRRFVYRLAPGSESVERTERSISTRSRTRAAGVDGCNIVPCRDREPALRVVLLRVRPSLWRCRLPAPAGEGAAGLRVRPRASTRCAR